MDTLYNVRMLQSTHHIVTDIHYTLLPPPFQSCHTPHHFVHCAMSTTAIVCSAIQIWKKYYGQGKMPLCFVQQTTDMHSSISFITFTGSGAPNNLKYFQKTLTWDSLSVWIFHFMRYWKYIFQIVTQDINLSKSPNTPL